MSHKRIPQREALRLRKRLTDQMQEVIGFLEIGEPEKALKSAKLTVVRNRELEARFAAQNSRWVKEWPASSVIHRIDPSEVTKAIVETAQALNHAVVVTLQNGRLTFWGVKP